MNEKICRNCCYCNVIHIHEQQFQSGEYKFECRRYAPREICGSGTGYNDTKFAEVKENDWCGEFQQMRDKEER